MDGDNGDVDVENEIATETEVKTETENRNKMKNSFHVFFHNFPHFMLINYIFISISAFT